MCNLDSDGCNSCASARCSMTCGSPGLHLHLHLDCLHLHHQQTHPASTPTSRALQLTKPPCSDLLKIPSLVGGLCWAATPSVTQKSAVTGVRQEKEILWCESLDKVMTAKLLNLAPPPCHQTSKRVTLLTSPLLLTILLVFLAASTSVKATVLLLPSASPELLTFEEAPKPEGWTRTGFKLVNSSDLQDLEVRWGTWINRAKIWLFDGFLPITLMMLSSWGGDIFCEL